MGIFYGGVGGFELIEFGFEAVEFVCGLLVLRFGNAAQLVGLGELLFELLDLGLGEIALFFGFGVIEEGAIELEGR